ncbi:MAG: glycosyltransferase [Bacteroidota bacterium]|nr:glycosyltransferase [Bacteroidota bacterium]
MKILLIMDPGIPVPPVLYGGHERLVYLFAGEYQKLGHEVTLLAGPGSYCTGEVVAFGVNDLTRSAKVKFKEIRTVWNYLRQHRDRFDRVHNFGRLIYLLPVLNHPIEKVMTYGRPVSTMGVKIVNALPNQNLLFTACSNYCVSTGNVAGRWKTVYNGIDFSQYELSEAVNDDAPLMFLGRLDRIKGAHTAIKVAKETNSKLIIAGNIPTTADGSQYFKTEIEPQIDNKLIKYVGSLNDQEKNAYLRRARALLFPIEWDEPFGMVMIEAMACGTPVIAFNRGSVPEVIDEKVSGFIVSGEREMGEALGKLYLINRNQCRSIAQERFDVSHLAKRYINLFSQDGSVSE